jgi:ABC-2 type transport system ATP-binding protein
VVIVPDAVVVEALTKRYGTHRGIDDVSFSIRQGEVFGFLGPNGAGKTTTMRLMLDLIRPTSGRVSIFGVDAGTRPRDLHARIGYLPGDLRLYDRMTAGAFLRYVSDLYGGGHMERAEALASRMTCDLSRRIRELSKGNRQKVGIIQAFMHEPDLLILDEPTSGLDPLLQQEFEALVREARAAKRTVFLSSHVLREVESTCDRVAFIREGRLALVQDVAQLRQRPVRRVHVEFASPVLASDVERLASVNELRVVRNEMWCRVAGDIDSLVKELARHEVVRIEVHEPDLEEVFMEQYGGGRA